MKPTPKQQTPPRNDSPMLIHHSLSTSTIRPARLLVARFDPDGQVLGINVDWTLHASHVGSWDIYNNTAPSSPATTATIKDQDIHQDTVLSSITTLLAEAITLIMTTPQMMLASQTTLENPMDTEDHSTGTVKP
ncbi:hypothetical protein CVT25_008484 [Psilocybe cyanescens]|uniref:Uncharacterized protein n=1 Tax=Psilocybe cyanescens TaxID=93625 RepID=A0A409XDI9_PSICY|nr:hypothetical protein CVT25_008484 [Psilocybe cyanescens]